MRELFLAWLRHSQCLICFARSGDVAKVTAEVAADEQIWTRLSLKIRTLACFTQCGRRAILVNESGKFGCIVDRDLAVCSERFDCTQRIHACFCRHDCSDCLGIQLTLCLTRYRLCLLRSSGDGRLRFFVRFAQQFQLGAKLSDCAFCLRFLRFKLEHRTALLTDLCGELGECRALCSSRFLPCLGVEQR